MTTALVSAPAIKLAGPGLWRPMAVMIFGVGAGASLLEGIRTIRHPAPVSHLWLSYGILALAAAAEGTS